MDGKDASSPNARSSVAVLLDIAGATHIRIAQVAFDFHQAQHAIIGAWITEVFDQGLSRNSGHAATHKSRAKEARLAFLRYYQFSIRI